MTDVKVTVTTFFEENFLLSAGAIIPGDDESFMGMHLLDSTGFLELVLFLEESFGIKVKDEEMIPTNLDSLNAIAAFVARKNVSALVPTRSN